MKGSMMSKQRIQKWMRPVATGLTAGVLATGCVNAENGASATAVAVAPAVATAPAARPAPAAPAAAVTAVAASRAAAEVPAASPYDKPGFYTEMDGKDGRLWVFRAGSEDLAAFKAKGAPAKKVLRPGAGPMGVTLKSTESATILEYVATKPGFHVEMDKKDERLWVFPVGSDDLASFQTKGAPAKKVLRPGAGPFGATLKSTEADTLTAYLVAQPGFHTQIDAKDGRLWVFRAGSDDLETFKTKGAPAKQVLRPGAGPMGLTLKSTEAEVLDAYLARF